MGEKVTCSFSLILVLEPVNVNPLVLAWGRREEVPEGTALEIISISTHKKEGLKSIGFSFQV